MKTWLINYFSFTKREYNAFLTLFGLVMLTIAAPYFFDYFFSKEELTTDFERKTIRQLTFVKETESPKRANKYSHNWSEKSKASLFRFDPNIIGLEDWKKLGLSEKQAQSIINYRSKGGKFNKPDDLKKMYVISQAMYERLQPYIELKRDLGKTARNFEVKSFPKKELVIIEVNAADTLRLTQIKGIGPAFARRIARYRQRLGGFYKKDQLLEVYGIDSLKFEEIKDQVQIDLSVVRKININTVDFESLKSHPYLRYKQINAIIQYRKQHGNYSSIADLKKILILSPQTIEKLKPYLKF